MLTEHKHGTLQFMLIPINNVTVSVLSHVMQRTEIFQLQSTFKRFVLVYILNNKNIM